MASLQTALDSREDVWGNAALKQTNGPDFNFFAQLLPPLRYVNTQFRYYPIVLSAPAGKVKPRLISNGSGINSRANLKTWHEMGVPVSFHVGNDAVSFGSDTNNLQEPRYLKGYLPVVQISFQHDGAMYHEETFAPTATNFSEHGVLFTHFTSNGKSRGELEAHIETDEPLQWIDHSIRDRKGRTLFWCDTRWNWDAARKSLVTTLTPTRGAYLATATIPIDAPVSPLSGRQYDRQRDGCIATWQNILNQGMSVSVPEPQVENAAKALIVGALMLMDGNKMNYSAGNAYQCMYEAESGDITSALLMWGNEAAHSNLVPLMDYGVNPGIRFHDAAFKLQLLAHYYWLSRDRDFVLAQRPQWSNAVELLISNRDATNGLLPREDYCGDEKEKVYSLNSDANAWRGLRDMADVLEDAGEKQEATRIAGAAAHLNRATLNALKQSEHRDVTTLFVPIALYGSEKPYEVLTATRRGSYWDLMIPYVLGSGIFGHGSRREAMTLHYLQEHGGLCMGMVRFDQHSGLFANTEGVDDLYTLRYVETLLQRDEPDRALVSFYGKLAQGMTRNTFISAEGTGLRPLDAVGRPMYLPPVGSGNALSLALLRELLVQDYDSRSDGIPDTLRLLFATPRQWLEDGKTISVKNAPTAFGPVSLNVISKIQEDKLLVEVELPQRNQPRRTSLRLRMPENCEMMSANADGQLLHFDDQCTIDLSKCSGKLKIQVGIRKWNYLPPVAAGK